MALPEEPHQLNDGVLYKKQYNKKGILHRQEETVDADEPPYMDE